MKKNITVFALVMFTLGFVATYSTPRVFADWLIDRSGTMIEFDSSILGDDDESSETVDILEIESESESESKRG
jgi:hypothetical protein